MANTKSGLGTMIATLIARGLQKQAATKKPTTMGMMRLPPKQGFTGGYFKPTDLDKVEQDRLSRLTEQYANIRRGVEAQSDEAKRVLGEQFARKEAILGPGASLAVMKSRNKGYAELSKALGSTQAEIGASEAGAKEALRGEMAGMKEGRYQFGRTMDFQENSFARQMELARMELEENKKTNYVNSVIALKVAKLNNAKDWKKSLDALSFLGMLTPKTPWKGSYFGSTGTKGVSPSEPTSVQNYFG